MVELKEELWIGLKSSKRSLQDGLLETRFRCLSYRIKPRNNGLNGRLRVCCKELLEILWFRGFKERLKRFIIRIVKGK